MKKILLLSGVGFSFFTFAEGVERALRQIGPMPFLTAGVGGLVLIIGTILSYVAICYGIYLLAKKYEPSLHPAWSWIPVANIYPAVKVSDQPLWWIAVLILGGTLPVVGPLISLISIIFIYHKISERTGRGAGTTALLLFFSVIALPWLGLTVNKKETKTAWVLGVTALVICLIGTTLTGAAAVSGFFHLNRGHNFMKKARSVFMREIQDKPIIREQIQEFQNQGTNSDATLKVDTSKAAAE